MADLFYVGGNENKPERGFNGCNGCDSTCMTDLKKREVDYKEKNLLFFS